MVASKWRQFWEAYACPRDKHPLYLEETCLLCEECGTQYSISRGYPDFRIANLLGDKWARFQSAYENSELYSNVEVELANLHGCIEVYRRLPELNGRFLDVGGAYGLVRYFLPQGTEYLSLDPWTETMNHAFRLAQDRAYISAFSFIGDSFAFICGYAERLPLAARSFDWVHMRSILDHVGSPYEALKEGWRILRSDGYLIIGVSATGGPTDSYMLDFGLKGVIAKARFKYHQEGLHGLVQAAKRRCLARDFKDHHKDHPSISQLRELLNHTGFRIEWEHWTKPPYDHVVYILARKGDGYCREFPNE